MANERIKTNNKKIPMSQAQYNLNTKTDYLNRKMFLDPAGPVTIQRFEEVKYNKIAKYDNHPVVDNYK